MLSITSQDAKLQDSLAKASGDNYIAAIFVFRHCFAEVHPVIVINKQRAPINASVHHMIT